MYAALYVSRAVRPMTEADLADILFTARRQNAERGITGRLVYAARGREPGTFAQWIEGDDWRVRELLYGGILRDGRHALVGLPFEGPTTRRVFPSWTMGFEQLPHPEAVSEEIERLLALAHGIRPVRKGRSGSPRVRIDAR
ncbi:MAG TPA: BLUF domain-containing protein [Bacteroidetes bacterium]|nr:BLUF domain-containing protein [Bacteroidota bacterium]